MNRSAIISEDGRFRYLLARSWDPSLKAVVFVMLNPSTADGQTDDATVRKCITFAKSMGCGSLFIVNLFAYRTKDPKELKFAGWLVGPDNNRHIEEAALFGNVDKVICAWGANARGLSRPEEVLYMLRMQGITPYALALTPDGIPRHPLYLPGSSKPEPIPT